MVQVPGGVRQKRLGGFKSCCNLKMFECGYRKGGSCKGNKVGGGRVVMQPTLDLSLFSSMCSESRQ